METKSQAKKGLSKIIGKTKSSAPSASQVQKPPSHGLLQRQASQSSQKSDASSSGSLRRSKRLSRDASGEEADEEPMELSGHTRSLPSSQEVLFKDVEIPQDEDEDFQSAEEDDR